MIIKNKIKSIRWLLTVIFACVLSLVIICAMTYVVDPCFHYHPPLDGLAYSLSADDERYQNDGIIRNFEYDTIITGTSMTENFYTSECDEMFQASSIKVPFSGGTYKDISDNLWRGFEAKENGKMSSIRRVIWGLDFSTLVLDKDKQSQGAEEYSYLTNDLLLDDVCYLLNKDIFLNKTIHTLINTVRGEEKTSFDEYANWNAYATYGRKNVLGSSTYQKTAISAIELSNSEQTMVLENVRYNISNLAKAYPGTDFYLFFTPYSIAYWDSLRVEGKIEWQLEAQRVAIEELLQYPNVELFSFCTNYEMVCNLDNYKDRAHYGEWINSRILQWMVKDDYLLTRENYHQYLDDCKEFYESYDYESLYVEGTEEKDAF